VQGSGDFPPAPLSTPANVQSRNAEYNLDVSGRVTHLDEKQLIVSFPVEIPEGTVLFTNIDFPSINATVRGLIRVRSQTEALDVGGYTTFADFVDLNDDERRKIVRLIGGHDETAPPQRPAAFDDTGAQSTGYIAPGGTKALSQAARVTQAAAPPRPAATIETVIWGLLGAIFYSIVILGIVALFPQGRAFELGIYHQLVHAVEGWPWVKQIFGPGPS
jgi:hypothetical protein